MKTYIYDQTDSPKRGYNIRISVYLIKRGNLHYVGVADRQSAGWKGDYATACDIISREHGHKSRGYSMVSKNIRLCSLGSTYDSHTD